MQYDFDEIIDRRGSNSVKWDAGEFLKKYGITERFDEESISMWVADMDFVCPQPVIEALHRRVDKRIFGYTFHESDDAYFTALQNWFKRRQDWSIKRESIVYSPGTVFALDNCVRAFTQKGEKVIIQPPVYSPFTRVVEGNERVVLKNELINKNGYYTIDFADLEQKAANPDCKMMFLCSPHNPVGRIWNEDELRQIARICRKNGVLLISDEIHGDLIRTDQTFIPVTRVADPDNIIVCTAINKTFNVAGLHCSNMVIENEKIRETYRKAQGMQGPSPFAIAALIAAYNEGEEWLEQLKTYLDQNFDFLDNFLKKNMPKVMFWKPQGTYIAWLDFSAYNLSLEDIHARIYQQANVILQDGKAFSENSALFQRMCIPTPRQTLEEALNRIQRVFNDG